MTTSLPATRLGRTEMLLTWVGGQCFVQNVQFNLPAANAQGRLQATLQGKILHGLAQENPYGVHARGRHWNMRSRVLLHAPIFTSWHCSRCRSLRGHYG